MSRQSPISRVFTKLHLEYRKQLWNLNCRFRDLVTVKTKQGTFTLATGDKSSISRSLFCSGQYESYWIEKAVTFLRAQKKCPPAGRGTILDIGANNGVSSISMLNVHHLALSVAIEPAPGNFSLLRKNVQNNKLEDRILCLPYAISAREGELNFELSDGNFGDHRVQMSKGKDTLEKFHESKRQVISVKAKSLDSLVSELPAAFTNDLAFVWIDVQGHEGHVFSGAKEFFSRDVAVVSEFWPYGIIRSGMTQAEYVAIVSGIWSQYWVLRGKPGKQKFVKYPINTLDILFEEFGVEGAHGNLIYMK
jgi:FkbM family methyltransferase